MAGMLEWLLQSGHLAGPRAGLLANMPGAIPPPEEAPAAADPNAGAYRPGSPLAMLFGQPGAVPAAPATPSDTEPSDVWGPSKPSTNDPFAGEPQPIAAADVPLPRPRPNGIGAIDDSAPAPLSLAPSSYDDGMSANAQATDRPIAPKDLPMPGTEKSLLDRVFNPNNAGTLLALAGGFSGAGSIGTGMRRAFSAAGPAVAMDRAFGQKQQTIADTYRALVAKGVPPSEALAASQNPEIMKAVAGKYFETKPRQHVMIKDALGGETPVSFDQNTGKYYDAAGKEMKAGGDAGGGMAAVLAPGVKAVDQTLSGEDYLNQFSPDVRASVKAYINGDVQPTGNPRQKAIATYAKTIAQRYGQDLGIPVSDALYAEKRKYRTELGSGSANSAGGQYKAFTQGIEHADSLAKKLEGLKNVDPIGIPSVAHGINWMRQAFSSKQTGLAKEAAGIGQTLAGEVGKLFSGAAGGGVHERELTRQRFNTITTPDELAGALEATVETMEGGLRALDQRREQILGPTSESQITNDTREKIDNVRRVIQRLRSGEAAPAAAKPGKTSTGINWSIQQ